MEFLVFNFGMFQNHLLTEFHETPMAGHCGIKKMLVSLSTLFYWEKMCKTMKEFVGECVVCQQTKYSTQAYGGLLQLPSTPKPVWEDASLDFITRLPTSKGLTVILVVVNRLTKYAHFGTLPIHYTAQKFAELFLEIVVKISQKYGVGQGHNLCLYILVASVYIKWHHVEP